MNEHAPPEHRSGFDSASHRYPRGLTFHAAMAICAAMLLTLPACRTPSPSPRVATPEQAPPPPVDATYDWHALLIAPFGNVLKEIPVALHEVLLFRDETHGSAAADDAECYAIDAPAPRFMGRTPDEYLLCFKQDRLLRIQAAVRLTTAEAPEVFATACAGWLKNANPATAGGAAPTASHCEGRDGAIRFSAHLEEDPAGAELPRAEPPRAEPPPAETTLSIILDSAPAP